MRSEKVVTGSVVIPASQEQVWGAWTTTEGVTSFFAPEARIELKPDGAYEMYFDLDSEPGRRGGEGVRILAIERPRMLSFTWNAPPQFRIRSQRTHVVVRLDKLSDSSTSVTLTQDGWGTDEDWQQVYEYFDKAWLDVVLPRLLYRFTVGPVNWKRTPRLSRAYRGGRP